MSRVILHIDFNSYFATVEQQANPRLRGKPIGVTGGDRMTRTVVGAASVEAKALGIRTGMPIDQARQISSKLILVRGDSDKYLETTKKFLKILKRYSPYVEVFSIDEIFLELPQRFSLDNLEEVVKIGIEIKQSINKEIGEWIRCSVGISYNKRVAKMAGSMYKPNGLVAVCDEEAAIFILDRIELDEICGIGGRIKKRLFNMGIFNFKMLRKASLTQLKAGFKSYGEVLFNMARGIDDTPIVPFYDKEEVKSIGHRHTISHDVEDPYAIKQLILKLSELISRRLRAKQLVGRTVSFYYRAAFNKQYFLETGHKFYGEGMQGTIIDTGDGLTIGNTAWELFLKVWRGESIRMVGISVSNLKPTNPQNLSLFESTHRQERIIRALDHINNRYGEFTLKRGVLINAESVKRMANPFLADRRFKA